MSGGPSMEIRLVWAEANGGAIGRGGAMPWHLPEDLAHFKTETLGAPVVMGRRTWESLPERFRPLPGRDNYVVTRDLGYVAEGAQIVPSLQAAVEAVGDAADDGVANRLGVIGGGQLYRAAMPVATELVVTRIELDAPGADTFAPEIGPEWRLVDPGERRVSATGLGYRFERYRRAEARGREDPRARASDTLDG